MTPLQQKQREDHLAAVQAWHIAQDAQRNAQAILDKANTELSKAFNQMNAAAATIAGNSRMAVPSSIASIGNGGWDADQTQRAMNQEKQNG